jgi:hypothetical protein
MYRSAVTRKPYNYGHNGDCVCANGFPVVAEGPDVAILRFSTTNDMSFR